MISKLIGPVQILLAVYFIIGAVYMIGNYQALVTNTALNSLPSYTWLSLGIIQIILAIGLLVPNKIPLIPHQASICASGLAFISMFGSAIYIAYTGLGIFWSIVPDLLAVYVAYKRWSEEVSDQIHI